MAIVDNPLMKSVRGALNKQVVFRKVGNKTIISAYPDFSKRKPSTKQKKSNSKWKEAVKIAKAVRNDPAQCAAAQVRLNITRNRVYNAVIKEYMKHGEW